MSDIKNEIKALLDNSQRETQNEFRPAIEELRKAVAEQKGVAELTEKIAKMDEAFVEDRKQINALAAQMKAGAGSVSNAEERLEADYREIFTKSIRGFELTSSEVALREEYAQKTMNTSVSTSAGAFIPKDFSNEVIALVEAQVPFLGLIANFPTTFEKPFLPTLTITKGNAGVGTEVATSANVAEPTFQTIEVPTFPLDSTAVLTRQALRDSAVDIISIIQQNMAEVIADTLGNLVINGSGSGTIKGLIASANTTGAYNVIQNYVSAANTALIADDYLYAMHSLPQRERLNGGAGNAWVVSSDAFVRLRALKDSSNNYVWTMGNIVTGAPDAIFGVPVYESPYFPSFAANTIQGFYGKWAKGAALTRHVKGSYIRFVEDKPDFKHVTFYHEEIYGFSTWDARALRSLKVKA